MYFLVRRRRLEVVQRLDVATHSQRQLAASGGYHNDGVRAGGRDEDNHGGDDHERARRRAQKSRPTNAGTACSTRKTRGPSATAAKPWAANAPTS